MDEAQYLADRVAVIAKGEIVAEGPPTTLGGPARWRRDRSGSAVPPGDCRPASPSGQMRGGRRSVELRRPTTRPGPLHELTAWALERGVALEGLEVTRPSLEDVYLELTGGEAGTE